MKNSILILCSIVLSIFFRADVLAVEQMNLYEKTEETMVNNNNFTNPFTQTELRLDIHAPAGRPLGSAFTFYGFHDGDGNGSQNGNVWKFRLLFDYPGTWTVDAAFYVPGTTSANGPTQTFTYAVSGSKVSPNEHGHVRVDQEHPRWFRFDDGTPWYPNPSVSHSYLYSPSYKKYVDEHLSRGVDAIGAGFRIGNTESDRYLPAPPWIYSKPAGSGGTPDFTRFNVINWQNIEKRLDYAQEKGMKLYIWFGFSGLNDQYDQPGPGRIGNANTQLYVKYFLARFAAYTVWWHWNIDSEYEENGSGVGNLQDQADYADYVRAQNPWKSLLSTHVLGNWTPKNNPSFDLATLQKHSPSGSASYIPSNYYSKPVMNAEGIWATYTTDTPDNVRILSWEHFMAGGHSAYSDNFTSDWYANWDYGNSNHAGAVAARGIQSIILSDNDFTQTEPSNNLVTLTGGNEAYCLADPGKRYLIFGWIKAEHRELT